MEAEDSRGGSGLNSADSGKVEVVEAVPASAMDLPKEAQNRDDSNGDQLALESADGDAFFGPSALSAGIGNPPLLSVGPSYPKGNDGASNKIHVAEDGVADFAVNGVTAVGTYGPPPDTWPAPSTDMPKIISLDVKCEKNSMKVFLGFDKPFFGIVFSKGHFANGHCVHLPAGLGRTSATFDIGVRSCGTTGNTENGLYGYGADSGSGTYFENTVVIQYDPQVQEVWDQARKLRCTWHDQYEKSVTFRPFPVDMLDVVRADFAGDNVGCWMQIQVGRGPWASEVSGLVKIGQTMTMVLAIKDDDSKFDMLVRNCMAHDGKRAPIQLVDRRGCVVRPKLMSRFTKIKNFGASASVLSYAHFQAFKFPDSMEVHFQCTIQICRYQCPDQCADGTPGAALPPLEPPPEIYGVPPEGYRGGRPREERRRVRRASDDGGEVGLDRAIRVVSPGDLSFPVPPPGGSESAVPTLTFGAPPRGLVCMTTPGFAAALILPLALLLLSALLSVLLCVRPPRGSSAGKRGAPCL
ncbi:uncharacterized protein [Hetaerina americana]|uniref:uncharacterized protein n=1 Tax=Hetaerina americana TaxID=62018 RepID=UPI003A7F12E2